MRVLHVITSLAPGGAENHLLLLAAGQVSAGHQVAVAGLKDPSGLAQRFADAGIGVHLLGLARYGDPRPVFRLRRLVHSFRPDIVHAHLPPAELYVRLALWGDATPMIITRHNDERFAPLPFGEARLARWCAARAARVICISQAVQRFALAGGRLRPDQTEVIRYAIEPARFAAAGPAADLASEHPLVGTLARLVPQKGLDILLDAFALVPRPAQLVIAGDGPLRGLLHRRAARPDLAGRVRFLGGRDDGPGVLAALDLFVLASRWEGFGLVLLEAMAAGRAIVATRVSAIPEVVADGETALLVTPEDPQALAQAITSMLEDAPRRAAMGRAGQARVRQDFAPEAMVTATLELYARNCTS